MSKQQKLSKKQILLEQTEQLESKEKSQNNLVYSKEIKEISNSPFHYMESEDTKYLVMGKYLIREVNDYNEAEKLVKERDYLVLMELIAVLINELKNK